MVVAFFKRLRFQSFNADISILIYHNKKEDNIIMMSLYIANFLIVAKHQNLIDWFKSHLKAKYNVKDLGEAKMIISWQIT